MKKEHGDSAFPSFATTESWAQFLSKSGFTVIPVLPGTKVPAGPWQPWLENQSVGHIELHWRAHPSHEVCVFAGHKLYALDADREESMQQLLRLEEKHGIHPAVVVKTTSGCHHYFGLPEGVVAKQGSHDSRKHPERLDVKTGRSLLMGPGSPGKVIEKWSVDHIDDLTPVTQAFVDDVARLNGQQPPSEQVERTEVDRPAGDVDVEVLERLVSAIPPEGYDKWTKVGMALHTETGGSSAGRHLYDRWSERGSKYDGSAAIAKKWESFQGDVAAPCALGTLKYLAKQHGANVVELLEPFQVVKTEVVLSSSMTREDLPKFAPPPSKGPRLVRHSLTNRIDEVERLVLAEKLICGGLMAMGETTLISAEPNTGKTALTLRLLVNSMRDGSLDPKKLIYLNLDDSSRGLFEKLKLASEYGFEMLAPGYGFKTCETLDYLEDMMSDGTALGTVVIVDTVTRLFDNNSKVETREFTDVSRRFSGQGGTMGLLGHCNKHRNKAGKLDFAGVSDLPNDVDCRYILDTLNVDRAGEFKVVGFENGKRRSSVKQVAAFKYSTRQSQSYEELLLSIQEVNHEDYFVPNGVAATEREVVNVVREILSKGPNTRMKLAIEVGERIDLSRVKILGLLEKHAGQHWSVTKNRKASNSFIYELLDEQDANQAAPVSGFSGSPVPRPATSPAQPALAYNDEENEEFEDVKF